jgi:hypothetical protein
MTLQEFIEIIVVDGIVAVTEDYSSEDEKHKLEGAIEGFNLCKGKNPEQILEEWKKTSDERNIAHRNDVGEKEYWKIACKNAEIEWVLNCISAVLMNEGVRPLLSWHPTARAVMKASEVLGERRPLMKGKLMI